MIELERGARATVQVKKLGSCRRLSERGVGVGRVPASGECSKQGMEGVKVEGVKVDSI